MFKMKKIAAVAAAAIMAVSTMAVSVNASTSATYSIQSNWIFDFNTQQNWPLNNVVRGLVQGQDTGITFRCTEYKDPLSYGLYGKGTIPDSELCRYQNSYVELSYQYDYGTVLFTDNWYDICKGVAPYQVEIFHKVVGSGQQFAGYSK